jgi:3-deoxy-7-phosphoheptulonate synthase
MIIPLHPRLTDSELRELEEITSEFGVRIQPIHGNEKSIYAILGDETSQDLINRIEGLAFVERVDRIQAPYKLMSRESKLSSHRVKIGSKTLPGDFCVIAGHCTIDPKQKAMFLETAFAVKEAGADMIRGGVWKPRTSPHSFQGDAKSLDILLEARERTGLQINTEVMDFEQLKLCVEAKVDCLQIGARSALNYRLLQQVGELTKDTPTRVLLKRSMHMGPVSEFILAAEYIVAQGNPNVMLCPRGTVPTIEGFRNAPDESITLLLKERTWAPVVVDPSHSVGKSIYVPSACLAAAGYGADGILVETHCQPKKGMGDDPKQAVTPDVLAQIIKDTREIHRFAAHYAPKEAAKEGSKAAPKASAS